MKKRLISLVSIFMSASLQSQVAPDSTYLTSYPDDNFYTKTGIYGKSLYIFGYSLENIPLFNTSSYKTDNDSAHCDTVFLFPNGNMNKRKHYENGALTFYEERNKKGELIIEGEFKNGYKQGYWQYYDERKLYRNDSVLQTEKTIYNSRIEKKWYNIYGEVIKTQYIDLLTSEKNKTNETLFNILIYQENGNNLIDSIFYSSLTGYKIKEVSYLNNSLNGHYAEYYSNGSLKTEGEYKDGQKSGYWTFYSSNNTVLRSDFFEKDLIKR